MVALDGVVKRIVVEPLSYVAKERTEEGRYCIKYCSVHATCESQERLEDL